MLALVPPTTSLWIFKLAVVKGLDEDLVNGASGKGLATEFPSGTCAKPPFLVGDFSSITVMLYAVLDWAAVFDWMKSTLCFV